MMLRLFSTLPARSALLAAAGALLFTSGCYSYLPIDSAALPQDRELRLYLTSAGSERMRAVVGPNARELQGRLLARSDSSYVVAMTSLLRESGVEDSWHGEPVSILRSEVDRFAVRELSRSRTVLAAVGLSAAAVLATALVRGFEQTGGRTDTGGGSGR